MIYFLWGLNARDYFSVHNKFDLISKSVILFYSYYSILIELIITFDKQLVTKLFVCFFSFHVRFHTKFLSFTACVSAVTVMIKALCVGVGAGVWV